MKVIKGKKTKKVKEEKTETIKPVVETEVIETKKEVIIEKEEKVVEQEKVAEPTQIKVKPRKKRASEKVVCRVIVAKPSYFVIDKNGEKITVKEKNKYHRGEEILY